MQTQKQRVRDSSMVLPAHVIYLSAMVNVCKEKTPIGLLRHREILLSHESCNHLYKVCAKRALSRSRTLISKSYRNAPKIPSSPGIAISRRYAILSLEDFSA